MVVYVTVYGAKLGMYVYLGLVIGMAHSSKHSF